MSYSEPYTAQCMTPVDFKVSDVVAAQSGRRQSIT